MLERAGRAKECVRERERNGERKRKRLTEKG